jgi:hypothetical protein
VKQALCRFRSIFQSVGIAAASAHGAAPGLPSRRSGYSLRLMATQPRALTVGQACCTKWSRMVRLDNLNPDNLTKNIAKAMALNGSRVRLRLLLRLQLQLQL